MKLADKIRYLREVEGNLRGLGRAMTQQELVKAVQQESNGASAEKKTRAATPRGTAAGKAPAAARGTSISQSYLSQIESGARPHLTNTTRLLLAKFFKVHPGYLVDDPEGYQAELMSDARNAEDKLDLWLVGGAERFRRDPALAQALLAVANHQDSRRCLLLTEAIIETPTLLDRLFEVLKPATGAQIQAAGEGPQDSVAKPELVSTKRSTARPATTTSVPANATTRRPQKGAARSNRK